MPKVYRTKDGENYTDNFSLKEIRCKCDKCKGEVPHPLTRQELQGPQRLRERLGRAFVPNSLYRCPEHPREASKATPGMHTRGAIDVPVTGGKQRYDVIKAAIETGATGIGVANSFVHVDYREDTEMAWKY